MLDPIRFALPGSVHLLLLLIALAFAAFHPRGARVLRRLRWALVALIAWCWILSTPGLANRALMALEGPAPARQPVPGRDAATRVVVLGSGEQYLDAAGPRTRLDAPGWERVRAGIALWKATGGKLVLAGGPDESASVAAYMRGLALEAGVPGEAIVLVPGSRTTYEDLVGASAELKGHRGPAWLVTSAMHMPRALSVARKLGLALEPFPCDFRQVEEPRWWIWLPANAAPRFWQEVLHEVVGRLYYRLRGWSE